VTVSVEWIAVDVKRARVDIEVLGSRGVEVFSRSIVVVLALAKVER
jgi:hypothetical protein